MRGINKADIITKYISVLGRSCDVIFENGDSESVIAIIKPIWHRAKSKFEGQPSKLGEAITDYSTYIGPATLDITKLSQYDTVVCDGISYYFVRSEKMIVGDVVHYCSGVLKRIYEEDEYEH